MRTLFCLVTAAVFLSGTGDSTASPKNRPKIGLALSGGGARGFSQIGVLRILEEMRVPIDYIAGTSIGSILGGMYASGYSVDEIEKFANKTDWNALLKDQLDRRDLTFRRKVDHKRYLFDFEMGLAGVTPIFPRGLVYGQKLSVLLQSTFLRVIDIDRFSELPVPFRAVATDIESGSTVVLDRGNLAEAVRASSALPGFFSPVEIGGKWLVDGGTSNNLPVDIVKAMGADAVIAVDISTPLAGRKFLKSFLDISDQSLNVLTRKTTDSQKASADVVISPELSQVALFDYEKSPEMIRLGFNQAKAQASELARFSLSSEEYEKYRGRFSRKPFEPGVVGKVTVEGARRADKRIVERHVEMRPGDPFNLGQLKANLNHIYGLGDFERADYFARPNDGNTDLIIRLKEKEWGPNFVRFALNYEGELNGNNDFNGLMNVTLTRLNSLGGEWRNDVQVGSTLKLFSEFDQPLDYSEHFFVAPWIQVERTSQSVYAAQDRVALYGLDSFDAELDSGIQFGKYGEFRAGLRQGYLRAKVDTGSPVLPSVNAHTAGFASRIRVDRLDNVYFPRHGLFFNIDLFMSKAVLGAEESYNKISFQWMSFESRGRHTGFITVEGGTGIGNDVPAYDAFVLGGFRSLSGYREEELRGPHYGVGRLGYLYQLSAHPTYFFDGVYLGAWGEAGNVWQQASDIDIHGLKYSGTLALGLDTKIGPVYFAYGQSDANHYQFYVSIGRTFIRSSRAYVQ